MAIAEAAGLLKQGNWQAAHQIVQEDESALGAWAHGIVHILEGDMANASYWYRRAGRPLPTADDVSSEIDMLIAQVDSG